MSAGAIDLEMSLMDGRHSCPKRYILVTGVTGTGKSTFIANATGDLSVEIGHELQSKTAAIQEVPLPEPVNGFEVVLVDMPGFNDTYEGTGLGLQLMTEWLENAFKNLKRLSGIIYIHNITDTRMLDTTVHVIDLLTAICGESFAPNIMLLSNMWSAPKDDREIVREKQLINKFDFWGSLIKNGARTSRYHSHKPFSEESKVEAKDIIAKMLQIPHNLTQFQREIFEQGKLPVQTLACRTVVTYLHNAEAKLNKEEQEATIKAEEETSPSMKFVFYKQAERARREKEKIRQEWTILATAIRGIGYVIAGLAERAGQHLTCGGILFLTEAVVEWLNGGDLEYPE
ncbi:hypothetical protein TWF281_002451 [Arthrobotrys megalospora]